MAIEPPILLRDVDHGGPPDQAAGVARALAAFVRQASHSLHIAIYDFRLSPALGDELIAALKERAAAGVDVRIAYDHTKPNTDFASAFAALGGDPAPKGTHAYLTQRFAGTGVRLKAVLTIPDALAQTKVGLEPIVGSHLMHHKYVVRDAGTAAATVWTGSTNFTDDAWTHQENNILQIGSVDVCSYFERDFLQLWARQNIASTGAGDLGDVRLGQARVSVAFAPGEGATIDSHLAALIASARRRIRLASMVLSSHKILGALNDAIGATIDLAGIYDATQMQDIQATWTTTHNPALAAFQSVARHLVGKHSVPYSPTGLHNFMHDKVVVVDDAVATGSFNLSTNATQNAENSLIIRDAALAEQFARHIDALVSAYAGRGGAAGGGAGV